MKQYVLDEVSAEVRPFEPLRSPPSARPWRMLMLLLIVEPIVLVAVYLAQVGLPSRFDEATSAEHGRLASSNSAPAQPQAAPADKAPTLSEPAAEPERTAEPSSHITEVKGKYVIELRGAAIGPALDMLSKATHTTVTGTDVFAGNPDRLHRSLVASSTREAWQAVFGDLANFAMACTSRGCAIHFVPAGTRPQPTIATEPAADTHASVSMPDSPPEPRADTSDADPEVPGGSRRVRRYRD